MGPKELNALIAKCFMKAQSKPRKCFAEGCHGNAINSHLLQKNGTLSLIAENRHVWQTSYNKFPKGNYTIKKLGINNALTFKGFCNHHDTDIFRQVESGEIDFDNYKNLLLLSYRALLKEFRDKEVMNDCFRILLKQIGDKRIQASFDVMMLANQYLMWDLEYDMACINEDLKSGSSAFHFEVFSLPKVEISCSACFSLVSFADNLVKTEKGFQKTEPIPAVVMNLIPNRDGTKLILGYNLISEKYLAEPIAKFRDLEMEELLKVVSDFIIRSVEMWACSDGFYKKHVFARKDILISLLNQYVLKNQFSTEKIDFNLFTL